MNVVSHITIFAVFVVAVSCGKATLTGSSEASNSLQVPLFNQETDQWCWAASAQMIMLYKGKEVSQCDQADYKFCRNDCCDNYKPAECIQPGWPDYDYWGFNYKCTKFGTALSWDSLKGEIDSNRPISFSWGWRKAENSGHIMDAVGYIEGNGIRLVVVNDPAGIEDKISYEEYDSGTSHTHWVDYYEIEKK